MSRNASKRKFTIAKSSASETVRPIERESSEHRAIFTYEEKRDGWKSLAMNKKGKETHRKTTKKSHASPSKGKTRMADLDVGGFVSSKLKGDLDRMTTKLAQQQSHFSILPLYSLLREFPQAARVEWLVPLTQADPLILRLWKGPRDDPNKQVLSHEIKICPLRLS